MSESYPGGKRGTAVRENITKQQAVVPSASAERIIWVAETRTTPSRCVLMIGSFSSAIAVVGKGWIDGRLPL
jgi:hypothetical protein